MESSSVGDEVELGLVMSERTEADSRTASERPMLSEDAGKFRKAYSCFFFRTPIPSAVILF